MQRLLIAFILLAVPQPASASLPCPKRYACWQVKIAVSTFGEAATEAHVRACGWSESKIAEARRCLGK